MSEQSTSAESHIETRLAALEAAVARLSAVVEPSFAVSHLAAPIAAASLKEAAQHEFSAKFFALLDLGESLIKYSAALAFAAAVYNRRPTGETAIEMFKVPPTLGKIAEGLRAVLDDTANADWPVDILRDAFRRPNGKPTPTARYLFDEFIRIRNDERGHGAQQPEGYYEGLYLKNYLSVHDCVRACTHVRLPLVHIHAVDHQSDQYAYKMTLLMGVAPTGSSDRILTTVKVAAGSTCLWDYGARLLPLHEFITYRYCPTCTLEHVFFAERITTERVSLHSYIGNHRLILERGGQ